MIDCPHPNLLPEGEGIRFRNLAHWERRASRHCWVNSINHIIILSIKIFEKRYRTNTLT